MAQKIRGIYCIENLVNGKKYIGQSNDIKQRWSSHKSKLRKNKHGNQHLQYAWNEYGEDNFNFYILEECDIENIDDRERYYIQCFDTMNREKGYNRESGGNSNKTVSEETRRLISLHHYDISGENHPWYGKKIPREIVDKMIATKRTNPMIISDEYRKIHSEYMKLKWKDQDFRNKMSELFTERWNDESYRDQHTGINAPAYGRIGEKHPMYGKHGKEIANSIPVICLNTLEIFESSVDAAKYKNCNSSKLCMCCRGERGSCGEDENGNRLVWMKYEDYLNSTEEEINNKLFKGLKYCTRKIINLDTKEIFNSIVEAAKSCNGNKSSIGNCCAGRHETSAGFHWMYYDEYLGIQNVC